jgi:hypothetical protein
MKFLIATLLCLSSIAPAFAHPYVHADFHQHEAHRELNDRYTADEYESMSNERERASKDIGKNIKDILIKAKTCTNDYLNINKKINSNPKLYSIPIIQTQWDEALSNLKQGLKCSQCGKTKAEFQERGENFEAHVQSVGGVIQRSGATPEDYERVNKLYSGRMKEAQELLQKLYTLKNERNTLIWSTFSIRDTELYPAYTKTFNYQLQSYAVDREQAVEILKLHSELLHLIDEVLKTLPTTHPKYKDYYAQRYKAAKEMKDEVDRLNVKRISKMDKAKNKKDQLVDINLSIQKIARELGDDMELGASGTWVASSFLFPDGTILGFYALNNAPEALRSFVNQETITLMNNVLSQTPTAP